MPFRQFSIKKDAEMAFFNITYEKKCRFGIVLLKKDAETAFFNITYEKKCRSALFY